MPVLSDIHWLVCPITLTCLRTKRGQENALFVFDAIFKYAVKDFFLFHPAKEITGLKEGEDYTLICIFPNPDKEEAEEKLNCISDWLKNSKTNFALHAVGDLQEYTVDRLLREWEEAHPPIIRELCLKFITPFPFIADCREKRWDLSAPYLGTLLIRRIERLFGNLSADEKDYFAAAWNEIQAVPYFWSYREFKHDAKSKSGTEFLQGFCGNFYLTGNLSPVLPILLLCSHINVGKRLSCGQGAYILKEPDIREVFQGAKTNPDVLSILHKTGKISPTEEEYNQIALALFLTPALKKMFPYDAEREYPPLLPTEYLMKLVTEDLPDALKLLFCESDCNILQEMQFSPLYPSLARAFTRIRMRNVIQHFAQYKEPPAFTSKGLYLPEGTIRQQIIEVLPPIMEQCGFHFKGNSAE